MGSYEEALSRSRDRQSPQISKRTASHREAPLTPWLLAVSHSETAFPSNAGNAEPPLPQGSPPPFLLKEQAILKGEIAAHNRSEAQALRALAAGKQALADTEFKGSSQTENVSEVSR